MTLHRLLLKEILLPFALALVFVCQLLIVMQMLQLNEVLFGSGFDAVALLKVAAYLAPHFAIIAVPLAFLLSVMLGLGRLAEDNELLALASLGRSPWALYAVPVLLSLVLGAGVGFIAFRGEPWGLRGIHQELNLLIKRNVAGDVRAGVFYESIPDFTIFVGATGTGDRWKQVLLYDTVRKEAPLLLLAQEGHVVSSGAGADLRLDLTDGELHRSGEDDAYTRAKFETGTVALGVSGFQHAQNRFVGSWDELDAAEMPLAANEALAAGKPGIARRIWLAFHRRIAQVLSCLVFGLIAVALAAGGKGSRGWGFAATVLAFACYYVARVGANTLGESGRASPLLAAWLPNLIGLLAAAFLARRLWRGPRQDRA